MMKLDFSIHFWARPLFDKKPDLTGSSEVDPEIKIMRILESESKVMEKQRIARHHQFHTNPEKG